MKNNFTRLLLHARTLSDIIAHGRTWSNIIAQIFCLKTAIHGRTQSYTVAQNLFLPHTVAQTTAHSRTRSHKKILSCQNGLPSLTTIRNLRALWKYIRPLKNQSERAKYLCHILTVEHEKSYKKKLIASTQLRVSLLSHFPKFLFRKNTDNTYLEDVKKIAESIQTKN